MEEDPPFQILVFLIILWILEGHEEDQEDPPPDVCPPRWRRMTIRKICICSIWLLRRILPWIQILWIQIPQFPPLDPADPHPPPTRRTRIERKIWIWRMIQSRILLWIQSLLMIFVGGGSRASGSEGESGCGGQGGSGYGRGSRFEGESSRRHSSCIHSGGGGG